MKQNKNYRISAAALLITLVLLTGACSEISLFTLLVNEQEGDFKMSQDVVNVRYGETYYVKVQGGFLPYSFATTSSVGTLNTSTGLYETPNTGGGLELVEIESSDRFGSSGETAIQVYPELSTSDSMISVREGDTAEFTVSGGITPYSVAAEAGSISIIVPDDRYEYTAPSSPGMDYIEITDSINNSISITVEVYPPAPVELEMLPTTAVILPTGTQDFTVTGGDGFNPGFSIDLSPNIGSTSNNGVDTITYTAPNSEGALILSFTDSSGTTVSSEIEVIAAPLKLTPSTVSSSPGSILEFTASGGIPPYTFTEQVGSGNLEVISATSVRYETNKPPPIAKIRVTDDAGTTAIANIDM